MAVTIFSERTRTGTKRVLAEGSYRDLSFLSTDIPIGWEIAIADRSDGPINLVLGPADSSGNDCNLMTWGLLSCSNFPRVEVRRSNGGPTGLLRGRGKWNCLTWFYLPFGKSSGSRSWRNDHGDTLCLPANVTAECWNSAFGDRTAGYVKLHGPGEISLGSLSGQVSNIELTADGLEAVGAPEMDWTRAEDLGHSTSIGSSSTLTNTTDGTATLSTEIGVDAATTAESNWQKTLSTGASVTEQTTVGTGEASPVKVEATLGFEFRFDASMARGGSHTQSSSHHVTETVSAECPPHSTREVQMLVKRDRKKLPIRQQMRNKVTGAISYLDGSVTLDMAVKTETRVRNPESM